MQRSFSGKGVVNSMNQNARVARILEQWTRARLKRPGGLDKYFGFCWGVGNMNLKTTTSLSWEDYKMHLPITPLTITF